MPLSSPRIRGAYYQLTDVDVDLDHPDGLVFIRFLGEVTFSRRFRTVLFVQPTLKGVAIHVVPP